MLIYENNNKLNINFDNEVSEYPDLQISKSGDETEVLIDGQSISGGSGDSVFLVNCIAEQNYLTLSETFGAIKQAYLSGQNIRVMQTDDMGSTYYNVNVLNVYTNGGGDIYLPGYENPLNAQSDLDYPTDQ